MRSELALTSFSGQFFVPTHGGLEGLYARVSFGACKTLASKLIVEYERLNPKRASETDGEGGGSK